MSRRAFVVIHLDSQISAGSALAQIALVQWAFDIIIDTKCRLHIVTMSPDRVRNVVPDLAKLRSPDIAIPELNLAALGDLDPVANARVIQDQDIASQLQRAIWFSHGRPVAIICLGNKSLARGLVQFCKKHKESLGEGILECQLDQPDAFLRWKEGLPRVRLILLDGNCPLIPAALEGFDQEVAWNNEAEQLVYFSRVTARDERRDHIWWARQPNARETYVYTGGSDVQAFLGRGYYRHRPTEDSHMCGFMALTMDMTSWGISPGQVFERFARATESHTAKEMHHRLTVQGVISDRFLLPEPDATAFKQLLPLVSYDHRLALFVALDSGDSDTMVRMVKIQLAALISSGFEQVLFIQCPDLKAAMENDARLLSQMIHACAGYGRRLARQGTMWLVLGLWKHFINVESSGPNQGLRALYDVVELHQSHSHHAQTLVDRICHDLGRAGIAVPRGMNVTAEVDDINETQAPKLSHKIIATDTPIGKMGVLDLEEMHRKEGAEMIFGVCHLITKEPGESGFSAPDWTYIPAEIVAEWKNKNAPGTSLRDALRSGVKHPEGNVDEFRGDS
ncbi:hypothetical protein BHE90_012517 [Fusarium euwallaceae]|nr:hypothetical protein BHE90_012517 [Fusarium euwallaceae]